MIKVNKKKFIKQLKASLKARKAEKSVLENGLFSPTQHDVKDELSYIAAFKNNISNDTE
jgi:hypothetical protein